MPGNSSLKVMHSNAMEVSHRNRSVCYIHHNLTKTGFVCASVDDLRKRWELPVHSKMLNLNMIQQMALDWVAENWYFLDDHQVFFCVVDVYLYLSYVF